MPTIIGPNFQLNSNTTLHYVGDDGEVHSEPLRFFFDAYVGNPHAEMTIYVNKDEAEEEGARFRAYLNTTGTDRSLM